MRSSDAIERLVAAAHGWSGTPFCANAAVKGGGVCCHRLAAEIYVEAGWMPRMDFPAGSPVWGLGADRSLLEEWLDGPGKQWFLVGTGQSIPGDLLGFRVGHCVHHLAIALPEGRIVHAVQGHGAAIVDGIPPAWRKRLVRIWRPKE